MGEGNSKPSQDQPFIQNFRAEHTAVQEGYEDPRLGKVSIYKHNSGAGYIAVKKSFSHSSGGIEKCQKRLEQSLSALQECPYLLKVVGYDTTDDSALCGSVSEMQTYHEYYLNNLEAEIQQRQQSGLYYSEQELWVILYSCIAALNFLAPYDRNINDLRPQNIYITPNGQLKLVPFEQFPEDIPSYLKVQHYNDQCYLAPEQLQDIRDKQLRSTTNQLKADMYAIGLTMLQCSTLNSSVDCYDWDCFEISEQMIEQRLILVRGRYSKFYSNMIRLLLQPEEQSRPVPSDISSVLEPYENQILNLLQFQPNFDQIQQHLNITQTSPNTNRMTQQNDTQQDLQQQQQFAPIQQQQQPPSDVFQSQVVIQQAPQQLLNNSQLQYQPQYATQQTQVQPGQALTFENLPLEVQQQIQRGEKGIVGGSVQSLQQQQPSIVQQQYSPSQPQQQPLYQQQQPQQQYQPLQSQIITQQQQQQPQQAQNLLQQQQPMVAQSIYVPNGQLQQQQEQQLGYQQQQEEVVVKPVLQQQENVASTYQSTFNQSLDQSPIRMVQGPNQVYSQQAYQTQPQTAQFNSVYQPEQPQQQQQSVYQQPTSTATYQQQQPQQQQSQQYTQSQPQQQQSFVQQQQPQQQQDIVQQYQQSQYQQQQQQATPSQYQLSQQQQYQPVNNSSENNQELNDIDKRINDVLNKTKNTLERVEQQSQY